MSQSDEIANLRSALERCARKNRDVIERAALLERALQESVKLQSHYAAILNDYDGGRRRQFSSSKEWIERIENMESA
jgi:hypothetical protein